ncbi:hypothetical protein R1flu_023901 [Riccia fluitans]|uniref:Reverse transcriptase n=1 Tax=Riccia fluitans TaxID=41844 RepID=A0ABD1XTU0_9MARC
MTKSLEQEAVKVGLRISGNKTKIMRIEYAATNRPVMVGQQQLEEVDKFTYLGSVLTNDGDADHDVACEIAKVGAVFQRLLPIWLTQKINLTTKIHLLNSIVIPTAIYASETWKTSAKIERRLNVAQQRWLRRILQVSYQDCITNEEIHRQTATRPLKEIVAERRIRLAGHIPCQQPTRLVKATITWAPPRGKRKQGRPQTTWHRTFIDDLKTLNMSMKPKLLQLTNLAGEFLLPHTPNGAGGSKSK